ncbi:MAG: hypothetical protein RSB97_07465, partial [Christensenella sp.]
NDDNPNLTPIGDEFGFVAFFALYFVRLFYAHFKDVFYEAVIILKTSKFQMPGNRIITKNTFVQNPQRILIEVIGARGYNNV